MVEGVKIESDRLDEIMSNLEGPWTLKELGGGKRVIFEDTSEVTGFLFFLEKKNKYTTSTEIVGEKFIITIKLK